MAGQSAAMDEGASTLLLISLAAATSSLFVFLLPFSSLARLASGRISATDAVVIVSAAGAPLWVILVVVGRHYVRQRHSARLLTHAIFRKVTELPVPSAVIDLLREHNVAFSLIGNPTSIEDLGGPIHASPRIAAVFEAGRMRAIILFPALAWNRLRGDPDALGVVIAHEVAHVIHRDHRRLIGLETILRCALLFVTLAVIISMAVSVTSDLNAGAAFGSALVASLFGKSSILVLSMIALISLAALRFANDYREALADSFAARLLTEDALQRAALKLAGDGSALRSWTGFTADSILYGPALVALYGVAIGALAAYLPSPLAFWYDSLPDETMCRHLVALFFGLAYAFTLYAGAYVLARLLAASRRAHPASDRVALSRMVLFAAMAGLSMVAAQTLPLMLTQVPIFDHFPNLNRHDAWPLLLASVAEIVTLVAAVVLAAVVFAAPHDYPTVWFWVGALVVSGGPIEAAFLAVWTFGMASFALGGLAVILALWAARAEVCLPSRKALGIVTLLSVSTVCGWLGYGGPATFSIALQNAAKQVAETGNRERALQLLAAGAKLAPFTATGFLVLAHRALEEPPKMDVAVEAVEHAIAAPYLNDWNERFEALVLAGEAHLVRRAPGDWSAARTRLMAARDLWSRSTRLDPRLGVELFYNSAVVGVHSGEGDIPALSHLVTALGIAASLDTHRTLARNVAQTAIDDADLAILDLRNIALPDPATVIAFRALSGSTTSVVAQALKRRISPDEIRRLLRLIVRNQSD